MLLRSRPCKRGSCTGPLPSLLFSPRIHNYRNRIPGECPEKSFSYCVNSWRMPSEGPLPLFALLPGLLRRYTKSDGLSHPCSKPSHSAKRTPASSVIMRLVRSLLAYSILLLAAAQPRSLLAQYQKYEGQPVVNIRFEPAEQPLEGAELFDMLPLKRDQPLRMSVVRASVERLFATGRYRDIQVDAEPYNGGVIVKFITVNSWFIGNVSVSGNVDDPPNRGQLSNATRLDLGQPYIENNLETAVGGQRRLLEGNGLYLSAIHPVFDYDPAHQQGNIRFEIDSGRRWPPTAVSRLFSMYG